MRDGRKGSALGVGDLVRLTERDRELLITLYWHGCLTTDHLCVLFFAGKRAGQRRLNELYRRRLMERFFPPVPRGEGSKPAHYLLDERGWRAVATLLGEPPGRRGRGPAVLSGYRHLLEVNEFFVGLVVASKGRQSEGLAKWLSAKACRRVLGESDTALLPAVRPDGWGLYLVRERGVPFFLELDRGTESGSVVLRKVEAYLRLHRRDPERVMNVLFCAPSERRAGGLRRVVGEGIASEEAGARRSVGPALRLWVGAQTEHPLKALWLPAPAGAPKTLPEMPSIPANGLRVEDCLGKRWWRWARRLGGRA